jgi:hypothetical protein
LSWSHDSAVSMEEVTVAWSSWMRLKTVEGGGNAVGGEGSAGIAAAGGRWEGSNRECSEQELVHGVSPGL